MYIKKNARVTFRSNRRSSFKRNNNFYNSKTRNKGNVTQQYNKYLKLAKEASSSGDRIQSEYYYQFTDHYYRLMVELGVNFEDNEVSISDKADEDSNQDIQIDADNSFDKKDQEENNGEDLSQNDSDDSIDSIESIPFIAEPVKKKSTKSKKEIV
jgi:hypothetical protein